MSDQMIMWHEKWEQRHGALLGITEMARYISIQLRGRKWVAASGEVSFFARFPLLVVFPFRAVNEMKSCGHSIWG